MERMVGLFINTIPVRVTSGGQQRVSDLLRQVQETALSSERHSFYPLYEIQSQSELGQGLVDHIVVFENYPVTSEAMNSGDAYEFTLEDLEVSEQTNYDFNVIVVPGSELLMKFQYNALVYDPQIVRNMEGHVKHIAAQLIEDAGRSHESIEIVTADERRWLEERNQIVTVYPKDKTIVDLFEEQAARTPEAVAVVCGDERLTYRELNERANRLAWTLREKGVGRESIIAIMAERSLEIIVGLWGTLKAGGAYLPIDPGHPEKRIRFMLEDSGTKWLLACECPAWAMDGPWETVLLDESILNATEAETMLPPINEPNDLMYVIYTSGTTGQPKGVMVEHRALHHFVTGLPEHIPLDGCRTIACLTTVSFDIFAVESLVPLAYGLQIALASEEEQVDPVLLGRFLVDHAVDILQVTPSRMQALRGHPASLSAIQLLKRIIVCGEALPPSLLRQLQQENSARLFNGYGPTETTVFSSVAELTDSESIHIGVPFANTALYIVHDCGNLQPIGVPGELCIAGDGLARGYLNRPEL
ncbi:AMP-binding protein, partial [Paenibacillus sp. MZ03-122A]|uniref:non-ribosomal peptide synthetase n=1 Tax=Paenibacillus sp. MZ03-122A TaxID=2962033 RepID=UPI0020B67314|nr:AMP-binding protein [Paenibacillus sp. MZ03-122A]